MKARAKARRLAGNFEAMEDRRLFAADMMANMDMGMSPAPVERPTVQVAQSSSVLDQLVAEGLPNPEDDDSPVGPQFVEVSKSLDIVGNGLLKPNPEDDDSPVGPLTRDMMEVMSVKPIQFDVEEIGEAELKMMSLQERGDGGEAEGKPDVDPDCDGNPLTASCDLTIEVPFDHAKPDDADPDCDGNPLTASCDLTAEPPKEHIEELAYPGDVDGDWDVDFADFLKVSENYGKKEATREQGDLDGDGKVGFGDFLEVSDNYGNRLLDIVYLEQGATEANKEEVARVDVELYVEEIAFEAFTQ